MVCRGQDFEFRTILPTLLHRPHRFPCCPMDCLRRCHAQALTIDWHRATRRLPLTPMVDAVAAIARAAWGAAPRRNTVIDLGAPPLARAV